MKEFLTSFAQNSEVFSSIVAIFIGILAISSVMVTIRMFEYRREAEKYYVKSLIREKAFIELLKNIEEDTNSFHKERLDKYFINSKDVSIFVDVYKQLDEKRQKQIEPALFQKDTESRNAYIDKVVSEARKSINMKHSHC